MIEWFGVSTPMTPHSPDTATPPAEEDAEGAAQTGGACSTLDAETLIVQEAVVTDSTSFSAPADAHPASLAFYAVLAESARLHDKKQRDYGTDGDPFANVRASEDFGIPAWLGCIIRGNDKVRRIQSFAKRGTLANESIEDALIDLLVYAGIGLVLYREQA